MRTKPALLRPTLLVAALGLAAPLAPLAQPATFNTRLLAFPIDVSLYAEGNPVAPGLYQVDVYLNDIWKGKQRIRFAALKPGDTVAQPCFDAELLDALGFDRRAIAAALAAYLPEPDRVLDESVCAPLAELIDGASARFDSGLQRLDVSAPHIVLARQIRGYVDPSRWDEGINATRLAYDYNLWHNKQDGRTQTSHYLGLRGGLNLGAWRLRYRGTANRQTGGQSHYRNSAFYIERALPIAHSRLLMGETTTHSQVFDSLRFRGMRLESEDRMRPDSRNGFVPVISGIAQSNARVTVHQAGVQIFELTVPPGPFVIDDLYPNGHGGDLQVTITEADGTERRFTVTYASLPEMLRPGMTRYSISAGRYRDRTLHEEPVFAMVNVSHGINNTVTAYGGAIAAEGYRALSAGVGLNLPMGAITFDATHATTQGISDGVGLRLAYNKRVPSYQTDFRLAVMRYASRGFYEAGQAFTLRDDLARGRALNLDSKRRHQFNLSIHQPLPNNWGALSISGSLQDYWNRSGTDLQYSLGYGRSFGRVSVSLNALRSRNTTSGRWDNQYLLSFSIPLGNNSHPAHLHTSLAKQRGGTALQTSVSGAAGAQHQYHYSLYSGLDKTRGRALLGSAGASASAHTRFARLGVTASAGAHDSRQLGVSATGGAVLFQGGVVLAPELGDTVALVQAKDAAGARVPSATGVRVNGRGHALVPYLQPYRENEISLDTKGLPSGLELLTSSQKVAPTYGAVVLLPYATRLGLAVLAHLSRPDGSELPFAAGVFDLDGNNVGYVAQGQQALLRLPARQGQLTVRWGAAAGQQCQVNYDLGAATTSDPTAERFERLEAVCE